jgi:DNA polymerase-1
MIVTDSQQILRLIDQAADTSNFAVIDTETDGLMPYSGNRICGIPLMDSSTQKSVYIPFRHRSGKNADESLIPAFSKILSNPAKSVVMWNAPFDAHMFQVEGVDVKCKIIDAQLGAHLNNENETGNEYGFPLKPTGDKYLGTNASAEEARMVEIIGGKDKIHLADPKDVEKYACGDTDLTWGMLLYEMDSLKRQGLLGIFNELSDYVAATIAMEHEGVLIDHQAVERAVELVEPQIEEQLQLIRNHTGIPDFNPGPNSKAVRDLFGRKKGESCDKEFLELDGSLEAQMILDYRAMKKLVGSFYNPFLEHRDPLGRIHPSIKLHGTVSGRPSCVNPNLQALPRAGGNGVLNAVRGMIIAPEGWTILSHDWSQIELRLLAHYTQDPNLIRAYTEGIDVHQMTSDALGIERDHGKRMNFGSVYGVGAPGFSRQARIPINRARRYLESWHDEYPTVRRLYRSCQKRAERDGYISMWTGRRKRYVYEWEYRKAMSGLIQGGVAEIMRVSIIKLHKHFKDDPNVRLFLQVHDDILAYVKDEYLEEVIPVFRSILEDFDFRVPVETETKVGKNWGALVKRK